VIILTFRPPFSAQVDPPRIFNLCPSRLPPAPDSRYVCIPAPPFVAPAQRDTLIFLWTNIVRFIDLYFPLPLDTPHAQVSLRMFLAEGLCLTFFREHFEGTTPYPSSLIGQNYRSNALSPFLLMAERTSDTPPPCIL